MLRIKFNEKYHITYADGKYGLRRRVLRTSKKGEEYEDDVVIFTNTTTMSVVVKRLIKDVTADSLSDGVSVNEYYEKFKEVEDKIFKFLENEGCIKFVQELPANQ